MKDEASGVEAYIATFPAPVQVKLRELRAAIRKAAPTANEEIAYRMPAYKLNGRPLVYFAGFKNHVGFFPTASGIANFTTEFEKRGLVYSKGAVQFPLDAKLPLALVTRIVKFRVAENAAKACGKAVKKPAKTPPKKPSQRGARKS
jgi:uncharacterized protein YdhG (YjbR/CyaY superfamily)